MNGATERLDEYACRAGTLRRGDRFTVAGGPYYKTDDGARSALADRGQMIFKCFCRQKTGQGYREWIEAWAVGAGFTILNVGREYNSLNVPGLVRRPYRVKRIHTSSSNFRGDDHVATKAKSKSKKQPGAKRTSKKGPAPETKEPAAPVAPTKNAAATDGKRKPKAKAEVEGAAKKVSALDAAAQVLADFDGPMNTKQMIEQMASKGLWTSPGGKTPWATLYSAILREITVKGDASRFEKSDRGTFTIKR